MMDIRLNDEVKVYIKSLSSMSEKAQIAQYLDRQAELGYRLKEPVSKVLRDGINELRPGSHRLLFFYDQKEMVMIHPFRKKTRRTPDREIDAAIRKRNTWRRYE